MKATTVNQERINILLRAFKNLGRINEDIVICAMKDEFMIFVNNVSHTCRPVIRFKPEFFNSYEYTSDQENVIFQITAKSITNNTKNLTNSIQLDLEIDTTRTMLLLKMVDQNKIIHNFELFLQDAISAVGDYFSTTIYQVAKLRMNHTYFGDIKVAFKRVHFINLSINSQKSLLYANFSSEDEEKSKNDSSLNIKQNQNCNIELNDTKFRNLEFSIGDFRNILRVNRIFSEISDIYLSFPGIPVVIRSYYQNNTVEVESAIATMSDDINNEETNENTQQIPQPPKAQFPPEPPKFPAPIGVSQDKSDSSQFLIGSIFSPITQERKRLTITVSASQSEGSSLSSDDSD
ncbi:hypothetical protein TVAG_085620 [Trichomonas vaginalis G3]|uniref:Uncharacterized protein n=1 Tax=Trichomonas vaginalis (strain ATCC PRA-98 / G3) TaxID=412133 RepID=A2F303_TRIV3|nr:DNA repair protein RAD9 family [Trichomonas vaginalis G3]EAY00728.1 hypothetical protein TVAG_085620 [Trichomonas vaginalis G3]KAI5498510.1 DNA repair protein RAD9 family [Trichomonas vaginalis G3]|eukprot:XP_001313657.1 hypothetical protein [Trichomonas vaginalis G3]